MKPSRASVARPLAVAWVLTLAAPGIAHAQAKAEPSPADAVEDKSSVALEKAREGVALSERGEHAAALALFLEADALYHSPVLVLYAARAQRKLGKLAEAAASYRSVTQETIAESAPPPWHKAKADARVELDTLEKEIEAERVREPTTPPAIVPEKQPPRAPPPVKPPPDEGPRPWWTFGIVATTVGGAALVGGAVVGGLAYEKSRVADTKLPPSCTPDYSCPDFVDPDDVEEHYEEAYLFANVADGLFVVGGVLAATGIVLLILDPDEKKGETVNVTVSPVGLSLGGAF